MGEQLVSVDVAFSLVAISVVIGVLYGWKIFKTPLNPLTFFSGLNIGFYSLLSGYACYGLIDLKTYDSSVVRDVLLITLIYWFGIFLSYFFRRSLLFGVYANLLRIFRLDSDKVANNFHIGIFCGLLLLSFVSFFSLAVFGGGGWLWLTDTRNAYITFRAGSGVFYASMQWFMALAYIYYLWSCRPRSMKLLLAILFFMSMAYFTGSKGNMLNIALVGVIYFNFYVRPVFLKEYLFLIFLFLSIFSALLVVQDAGINFFVYLSDYFNTTAIFLSRFNEFGYQAGKAWLGDFWFYVPRSLFPGKPYEYGVLIIHQTLFPGMAETGNTPGFLKWTPSFLDFGIIGVFFDGFLTGTWHYAVYEYYNRNRSSLVSFVFMVQFTLFQFILGGTILITVVLMTVFLLFCGIHAVKKRL